jgi:hypothetical protein
MESLRQVVLQEINEERYNRKHIDAKIRAAIEGNPEMVDKLKQGVEMVKGYMSKTYTYKTKTGETKVFKSKMQRIAQLENLDVPTLVMDIFVGIAYCLKPELFTSISAQVASRLKFSDRKEAITTVAELMAVLCMTDAFDIIKESKSASLMVRSRIPLSTVLVDFIEGSQYLPPMVCEPLELTHNYSSGYLTHNDSLILGTGNHHDGDICLDVLNTMNKVALRLDTDFLSTVEETPTFELDSQDKREQWDAFKKQSYQFYELMVQCGNRFYLTHKVDKRGRIYACGYHISTMGAPFKKASIELSKEELVRGVP